MSFVYDKCIYVLSLRGDAHDLPSDMVPCGLRGYYTILPKIILGENLFWKGKSN
jgi:hypothetical protein